MATRTELRTRARIRADQDAADFPTDAQYNYWLDEAAKDAWFDLVQAGMPLKWSTTTLTVSGAQFTSLGVSNVAFVRGVYRVDGSQYYELPRIAEGDRATLLSSRGPQAQGYSVLKDPAGTYLELLPLATGQYLVEYFTEYAGFSGDSDTWFGPSRSDELITIKAAIKGVKKEGRNADAESLKEEYRETWVKVTSMASWFDMRNGTTIRDVHKIRRQDRIFDFDVEV